MAFRKFQKAEKVEPVSDREKTQIRQVVKTAGKKSAADLTEAERAQLPKH